MKCYKMSIGLHILSPQVEQRERNCFCSSSLWDRENEKKHSSSPYFFSLPLHHPSQSTRWDLVSLGCLKYCHDDDQGTRKGRNRKREREIDRKIHATSSNCVCVCFLRNMILFLYYQIVMVVRGVIICSASQGLPSIAAQEPLFPLFHSISLPFLLPSLNSLFDASHALIPSTMPLFPHWNWSLFSAVLFPSFPEESSFFTWL